MSEHVYTPAISAPALRWFSVKANRILVAPESDEDVIELVRDGDKEAFGVLVKRYQDFVFTLARGIVSSDETARDVAQEAFLRAYRAIRRFEKRSSFKTWLYRIAYNTAMSFLKERALKSRLPVEDQPQSAQMDGGNQTLRLTVEKLVGLLRPDLRAVIIFHYYHDLKYEEIAEIMNCPVGTVKIRLYRAKHDLKGLWERYAV